MVEIFISHILANFRILKLILQCNVYTPASTCNFDKEFCLWNSKCSFYLHIILIMYYKDFNFKCHFIYPFFIVNAYT